jgi:hypothetical protein
LNEDTFEVQSETPHITDEQLDEEDCDSEMLEE